ncbi:hypothetical protein SAMN04487819_109240 [Actinopolyspora alba]|uniref:Uncharacterized protein n=1 Tax=Actinopolyspora alba TaxID=673379 RepID=A0A1I1YV78_9ACTN|nr:hypothetical protein SAMN04487819_109240 [Actinopolyspora alba]
MVMVKPSTPTRSMSVTHRWLVVTGVSRRMGTLDMALECLAESAIDALRLENWWGNAP